MQILPIASVCQNKSNRVFHSFPPPTFVMPLHLCAMISVLGLEYLVSFQEFTVQNDTEFCLSFTYEIIPLKSNDKKKKKKKTNTIYYSSQNRRLHPSSDIYMLN